MTKDLFSLKDKVIIITGGAGLLGVQHAEEIEEFGGIPVILDINDKEGNEKSKKIHENQSKINENQSKIHENP